jgi:hypothetical protein
MQNEASKTGSGDCNVLQCICTYCVVSRALYMEHIGVEVPGKR